MEIKVFHTADLHLGMKFARGYAPEVQESLIEARFETLKSMVGIANSHGCDMFVVAGDLFDSQRVAKKDVVRAAESLKKFDGKLIIVLPGNHDYIQQDEETLWRWFRSVMSERTLLLEKTMPYDLKKYDLDVVVYPGPCTAKHSSTNAIGWIKEYISSKSNTESSKPGDVPLKRDGESGTEDVGAGRGAGDDRGTGFVEERNTSLGDHAGSGGNSAGSADDGAGTVPDAGDSKRGAELPRVDAALHVGIAHGSMEGLSPDFNADYFPMTGEELQDSGLDLWLMGHTHVRYPDRDSGTEGRIFFPSTPEPDGFDCRHAGHAWLIETDENKHVRFQSIRTGKYRFVAMEREVSGEEDLEALKAEFKDQSKKTHLVKLKLKGRLAGEAYDMRSSVIEEIKSRVLYLEIDLSELYREITTADIDREFTEGSFPHRLLTTLAEDQKNPLSLQMAYDFIRKAGS